TTFVVAHPQVTLAVLEVLLDPHPAATHQRQHCQRSLLRRVRYVVLHFSLTPHRTPDQQPDGRPWFLVAHRPDTHRRELKGHRFAGTFPQAQYLPRLSRQRLGHRLHAPYAVAHRPRRLTAPSGVLRDLRRRVLRPDGRRDRHLAHVKLLPLLQVGQE